MVVRLDNQLVVELFPPEFQTVDDIEQWYSREFARNSVLAPGDVKIGMTYNPSNQSFRFIEPPPTSEELLNILLGVQ